MKRITPTILTALSAFALSLSVTTHADNTDNDGFIVFQAQEETTQSKTTKKVEQTKAPAEAVVVKKPKAKKKTVKRAKRKVRQSVKRAERKKRRIRTTRAQRIKKVKKASTYRVRSGDTLYRIAIRFGVKLDRLAHINKLYGNKKHSIKAGTILRLR